jgi:SAM-dependent methyltransferase
MSDPWSEIMKDAVAGKEGRYYIEREDGRIETLDVSDYIKTILDWDDLERLGIQHAKGTVLDIGCGAGRVGLYLKERGLHTVGIDLAPGAIEACKSRGLETYQMSAGDLDFPDATFDTVIMYGNNFGILGDDGSIIKMLKTLHRITTDDGIIIAQSADIVKTDTQQHLDYHKLNVERGRPKGLIKMRTKYKDMIEDWWDLRLTTPEEMSYLAEQSGWKLERKYQSGVPYVGVLVKS